MNAHPQWPEPDHSLDPDLLDRANKLVGNWLKFESFGDHSGNDPREWGVVYTDSRDSDELAKSNAACINKELHEVDPECNDHQESSHGHWAAGYVNCIYLKPFTCKKKEEFTPAFLKYCELQDSLENYPVLDEEDYSSRQWEYAKQRWNDCTTKEKNELKKRFRVGTLKLNFSDVMHADDGGLFDYLSTH